MSDKDIMTVGKIIRMPCMRKGIVQYPKEKILVSQEALACLADSAKGIPVVMDHPKEVLTEETIREIEVAGRVVSMDYDFIDDLWYANFVVDHQMAVDYLKDGWGISTAWFGDKYTGGGTVNNVPYDRELLEGRYEHLAIVKSPRYEMARNPIFLNSALQSNDTKDKITTDTITKNEPIQTNSKKDGGMISKLFKRLTTREELKTNEGEEIIVDVDGSEMTLSALVSELKDLRLNKKNEDKDDKDESEEEEKMANETDKVDVDGEKMSVAELKDAYLKNKAKSNSTDNDKPNTNSVEDEAAAKAAADAANAEAQKNFEMIKEVHENGVTYSLETEFVSTHERVSMGKKKYGTSK